jgi:hypothetical protein
MFNHTLLSRALLLPLLLTLGIREFFALQRAHSQQRRLLLLHRRNSR